MVAPTWSGPGAALRGAVLPPVELSLPRGRRDGAERRREERRSGEGEPGRTWRRMEVGETAPGTWGAERMGSTGNQEHRARGSGIT